MKRALIVAAALAVMPTAAGAAGYLTNRTDWIETSETRRVGYMMGALDTLVIRYSDDTPDDVARKTGWGNCLAELKLTGADLASLVSEGYAADSATWTRAPNVMLMQQVAKVCLPKVNEARVAARLPPVK